MNEKNIVIPSDKTCYPDQYYHHDNQDCDIYFKDHFDALQTRHYKLIQDEKADELEVHTIEQNIEQESYKELNIDLSTTLTISGDLKTFTYQYCKNADNQTCINHKFDIGYFYYKSFTDEPSYTHNKKQNVQYSGIMGSGQKSGAYIFRPLSSYTYPMAPPVLINITQGEVMTELRVI